MGKFIKIDGAIVNVIHIFTIKKTNKFNKYPFTLEVELGNNFLYEHYRSQEELDKRFEDLFEILK